MAPLLLLPSEDFLSRRLCTSDVLGWTAVTAVDGDHDPAEMDLCLGNQVGRCGCEVSSSKVTISNIKNEAVFREGRALAGCVHLLCAGEEACAQTQVSPGALLG